MDMTANDDPLTEREKLFIKHYTGQAKGNATAAARLAGYSEADNEGYRLKKRPRVRLAIDDILTNQTLTSVEVLERLTQHANGTIEHFVRQDGGDVILDITTPQAIANLHLIKKVKTRRKTTSTKGGEEINEEFFTELELHDPQSALVQLGRFHKLFNDHDDGVDLRLVSVFLDALPERLREGVAKALAQAIGKPLNLPAGPVVELPSTDADPYPE